MNSSRILSIFIIILNIIFMVLMFRYSIKYLNIGMLCLNSIALLIIISRCNIKESFYAFGKGKGSECLEDIECGPGCSCIADSNGVKRCSGLQCN